MMITWWDDESAFKTYLRSESHKASHARIPKVPAEARGPVFGDTR